MTKNTIVGLAVEPNQPKVKALTDMTVAELKDHAADLGIELEGSKKDEIIAEIEALEA